MKHRLLLILIVIMVLAPHNNFAGMKVNHGTNCISVTQNNYKIFGITGKPDSVALSLKSSVSTFKIFHFDTSFFVNEYRGEGVFFLKYIDTNAKANEIVITHLIANHNIAYVRCYFKNAKNKIFKYSDLSPDGKIMREMYITDVKENRLECTNYSDKGNIISKTQYVYDTVFTRKKYDDTTFIGYDTFKKAPWYSIERGSLTKIGKANYYYNTGELNSEIYYSINFPGSRDSTITYNKNGKITAKTINGITTKYDSKGIEVAGKVAENKKALLIGIDKYNNLYKNIVSAIHYANTDGSANDVNGFKQIITDDFSFSPGNIITLTDEAATKNNILSAFNTLVTNAKHGDIIFIHFSSHGGEFYDSISQKKYFGVICSNFNYEISDSNGIISDIQLQQLFNSLRKKIGASGQLVISLDVSHSGMLAGNDNKDDSTSNDKVSLRGESNHILLNITSGNTSPVVIFTSTMAFQYAYEIRGDDDKTFGAYTWAMMITLGNVGYAITDDINDELKDHLQFRGLSQIPCLYETRPQILFEGSDEDENKLVTLPEIKTKNKCFTINVGISDYKSDNKSRNFKNCTADAGAYAHFFSSEFNDAGDEKNISSSLLVNASATKDSILKSINDVISNSRPDDYFIFNFSGYCRKLMDTGGRQNTYFVPYGLSNIDDTVEIKQKSISLTQLKDLLQLIPANNQLFITEAGSTDDFQKEFIQALIESSPTLASLSNKNRFFIVPKGTGLDRFNCRNMSIDHGPLNYYITSLPKDLNIFGLFDSSAYSDAITYSLNKTEIDCDYFRSGYFDIFSERKFTKDMRSYLPEEVMHTRGIDIVQEERKEINSNISHRYALVIGNDHYDGKPNWRDLNNPVYDATDVAYELENGYDYKVFLLTNAKADSVYWYISYLAHVLHPSDQLLIYAAGHGDYDANLFDDGFIVCKDSKPIAEDPYRSSYIQFSRLSRMVNKLPSRQILMMLDVCFGGAFDARVASNKTRGDAYTDLSNKELFTKKLKMKTRIYITSGGKQEVPDGYKGKHSPFAQRIIQALQTHGGSEKILTATNLYDFVQKLPSGPLKGSFEDDEPGSEFLLLAK